VKVEQTDTPFTAPAPGQVLRIPIAHGEGNYYASPTSSSAREESAGVFRYATRRVRRSRGEPEWIGRQHRRLVQRGAQRGGPDAAPRARV
jgi:hypothetical protein